MLDARPFHTGSLVVAVRLGRTKSANRNGWGENAFVDRCRRRGIATSERTQESQAKEDKKTHGAPGRELPKTGRISRRFLGHDKAGSRAVQGKD